MIKSNNQENYISDIPIRDKSKDRFQRYNFSKRIADTIINRKTSDSIVIGVYGNWGEGKTSVINFIEENLLKNTDIVVCKFNPWRFKNEDQLLIGFFNTLANQLKKSLKTKGEKIGELISTYADVIIPSFSFGGIIETKPGETLKKIADKISNVEIDELKKRIEDLLLSEKKKVVVFIDDIDRLDKKEIQAVFKLVKLTGDFSFTSYVLAFDEEMVSKAIGESYEDGGEQAGRNFLEKIIQVPLRLPLAQKEALKLFCIEQINNALDSNNINLNQEESLRFVREFTSNILLRLSTPRMAVRYGNALSFAIPLLVGEVNTVDLMLIEAIKIFYPDVYTFIKQHPTYFLASYSSGFSNNHSSGEEKKKKFRELIAIILKPYTEPEAKCITNLLTELFPILNEVYHNYAHHEGNYKKWNIEKRIGSAFYFNRYFSYTVITGEISDIEFDELYNIIISKSSSDGIESLKSFFLKNNPDTTIFKFRLKEKIYTQDEFRKIALVMSQVGSSLPSNESSLFGFDSALGQAAIFLVKSFENIPESDKQFNLAKELVEACDCFNLCAELVICIRYAKKYSDEQLFTAEQLNQLGIILLEKAKKEAGDIPLFEKFHKKSEYLLSNIWSTVLGKESLMKYLTPILDAAPEKIKSLISAYVPVGISSAHPKSYYRDFEPRQYDNVNLTFDVTYLYSIALKVIGTDNIKYEQLEYQQTEENILKQFMFLHQESVKNNVLGYSVN